MIKEFEKNKDKFIKAVREKAESGNSQSLNAEARDTKDAVTAYAAAFCAIKEGLGLTPYDTQIMAGAYLDDAAIVERATGEGKTIAAVFAVYYSVIKGEKVNVFTFNDYLAKRDRTWMKPAYDLLGLTSAYITEETPRNQRAELYESDVVYSTAKECGFDYLRDFTAFNTEERVSGKLQRVIVDEADSVLIDEARIPLIIAGSYEVRLDADYPAIFDFTKTLSEGEFEADPEAASAYLTPKGQKKAEEHFGVSNIYDEENNDILTRIGDCLEALYVLRENVDYIVKDNQICIIDKFTGRVSEERHFPSLVHAAVEMKHGLQVTERGVLLGDITIQYFIRLFEKVSGMTGTAATSKREFETLYGLIVRVVEPNTPSQREDLPMAVYYDKQAKLEAAADEVQKAHEKGQPVLVGNADIDMSEEFSGLLKKRGVPHTVLNAKNDELEAEIVKNAGMPGAVTVSTNMTGRGVDIKLGGEDEKLHDEVAENGGLYVICTFMAESSRINNQLYGRAGRQGDPGQSRLFVSLDEDIMEIFDLKKNSGRHYPTEATSEEIQDKTLSREILRVQQNSQDKRLDQRKRLMEFALINEKHRQAVFLSREKLLMGGDSSIWQDNFPEEYSEAVNKYGEEKVNEIQRIAAMAVMNQHWSEYLDFTASLREGIHLRAIGGKDPAEEYNIESDGFYQEMGSMAVESMGEILASLISDGEENVKISRPTRTWTYLLAGIADKLKRRTLAEYILDDGEYEDPYSDEYDEVYAEESAEEADEAEDAAEEQPKKGFFARLFGKK
ncbi:MAG: preprotein translocase subunit SecA [Oscillospiraceae bacterium]|nr:preprotein translocase subunit SecA [Oscillospiraceae bacterium]